MEDLFIDSTRTGKVFNPATGDQSAEVKLASSQDVNKAVTNAKNAFEVGLILHHFRELE